MMPSADRRGLVDLSTCTCTAVWDRKSMLPATDKVIRHRTRERGLFISLSLARCITAVKMGHSNMHCACTYLQVPPPIHREVSSFVELDSPSPLKEA